MNEEIAPIWKAPKALTIRPGSSTRVPFIAEMMWCPYTDRLTRLSDVKRFRAQNRVCAHHNDERARVCREKPGELDKIEPCCGRWS